MGLVCFPERVIRSPRQFQAINHRGKVAERNPCSCAGEEYNPQDCQLQVDLHRRRGGTALCSACRHLPQRILFLQGGCRGITSGLSEEPGRKWYVPPLNWFFRIYFETRRARPRKQRNPAPQEILSLFNHRNDVGDFSRFCRLLSRTVRPHQTVTCSSASGTSPSRAHAGWCRGESRADRGPARRGDPAPDPRNSRTSHLPKSGEWCRPAV